LFGCIKLTSPVLFMFVGEARSASAVSLGHGFLAWLYGSRSLSFRPNP
jgi:hypothetical protein